jgi:hypothetical protein
MQDTAALVLTAAFSPAARLPEGLFGMHTPQLRSKPVAIWTLLLDHADQQFHALGAAEFTTALSMAP